MFARRIIPCLDVSEGRVVKGVKFVSLKDAGDPVSCARAYDRQNADELVFLDITASYEKRKTTIRLANKVAESIFLPFTVGGVGEPLGQHLELILPIRGPESSQQLILLSNTYLKVRLFQPLK